MKDSAYGVLGNRSPAQSKKGLTTTAFIMAAAESSSFVESGSPKSYPKTAWPHSTCPSTAFA